MINLKLTAAFAAGLFAASQSDAHAASLINGDFEDISGGYVGSRGTGIAKLGTPGHKNWDIYKTLNGWTSTGPGIEIQTAKTLGFIDAQSGGHYVELDSKGNSGMAQQIALDAGKYALSFYYSPRKNDATTNGIRYSVQGQGNVELLMKEITGPSADDGISVGKWSLITSMFIVGENDGPVTLSFLAIGESDSYGGLLDNIAINAVPVSAVPVPAALPLLITGLAGLGFLSRRKRPA